MDWSELNGAQVKLLRDALLAAFNEETLTELLAMELDRSYANLHENRGGFSFRVFQVIGASQREGWTEGLVKAAQANSPHKRIKALSAIPAIDTDADAAIVTRAFEKITRPDFPFVDHAEWGERYARTRRQVCRVEDPTQPEKARGTGFLVAPDLVLTNFHVVERHLGAELDPKNLVCRFDYAVLDGARQDGRTVPLADAWCVARTRYSPADLKPDLGDPAADELDFALLRLAEPIGADGRGWLRASGLVARPQAGDVLFIAQHPVGAPIKIGIGRVLSVNANATRLRYDANTEGGSSGSPCLNAALDLVALHHLGDTATAHLPQYNQGVPVDAIVAHLKTLSDPPVFWQD